MWKDYEGFYAVFCMFGKFKDKILSKIVEEVKAIEFSELKQSLIIFVHQFW